jgi:uncharacterized membrane protein YheB (UPF0754 family)
MYCDECGGICERKSDELEVTDPYVGSIAISGLTYYKCNKCGTILYSLEMSQALDEKRKLMIKQLLGERPINDFISAAETAKLLNISRQALHKNLRIKHGFIFQTQLSVAKVYLKQSVLQYKKTGDGRFSLVWFGTGSNQYIRETIPLQIESYQYHKMNMATGFMHSTFRKSFTSLEESTYVKN